MAKNTPRVQICTRVQINLHHFESRSKFAPGCKFLKHRSHGQKYTPCANLHSGCKFALECKMRTWTRLETPMLHSQFQDHKRRRFFKVLQYIGAVVILVFMLTCPCNVDSLTPHLFIVKLGFSRVYNFCLLLLWNIFNFRRTWRCLNTTRSVAYVFRLKQQWFSVQSTHHICLLLLSNFRLCTLSFKD